MVNFEHCQLYKLLHLEVVTKSICTFLGSTSIFTFTKFLPPNSALFSFPSVGLGFLFYRCRPDTSDNVDVCVQVLHNSNTLEVCHICVSLKMILGICFPSSENYSRYRSFGCTSYLAFLPTLEICRSPVFAFAAGRSLFRLCGRFGGLFSVPL